MQREEILNAVEKIFRDVFDNDELVINNDTNANDIEEWDSLEQINILVAVEKKFSIKFNIKEVTGMKNVGDMISQIERKIGV